MADWVVRRDEGVGLLHNGRRAALAQLSAELRRGRDGVTPVILAHCETGI